MQADTQGNSANSTTVLRFAVQRLVVMGGNEARNDWTATGAEFNFFCDPDAAAEVIHQVHYLNTVYLLLIYPANEAPSSRSHLPLSAISCLCLLHGLLH